MRNLLLSHRYEDIISIENLLLAWQEFVKGKRLRSDVQLFERSLMENLFDLHRTLIDETYRHSDYEAFSISDPKHRKIHKATVRDRVLHRAVYRIVYPFFDRLFIHDSYSCRNGKGTHRALDQFNRYARKASKNHRRTVWVLKCDIRKFFASIDQSLLLAILADRIPDRRILSLLEKVIYSFSSTRAGLGLPLGNLTSQVFSNIYMNEFDRFVKHSLHAKYYIRYADDFVIFSSDRERLLGLLGSIQDFLSHILRLDLHPDKIEMKTVASGVDFLGWVHFLNHRVLRTVTKRRMLHTLAQHSSEPRLASYSGLLKHGDAYHLEQSLYRDYRA